MRHTIRHPADQGRLDLGIYNLPSHIPANFPVATGMAFAAKYRGQDRVCLAFCGDGSTSRADFHEALTMASVLKLPNVFVIGASAYPQNASWNPTGTLGALTYWAIDALKNQYLKNPGRLWPA